MTYQDAKKIYSNEAESYNIAFNNITINDKTLTKKKCYELYVETCERIEYLDYGLYYIEESHSENFIQDLNKDPYIIAFKRISDNLVFNKYFKNYLELQTSNALIQANETMKLAWDTLKKRKIKGLYNLIAEYETTGYNAKLLDKPNSFYEFLEYFNVNYSLNDLNGEEEYIELFEKYYSDDDTNYKRKFVDDFVKYAALNMINEECFYAIHCLNTNISPIDINDKKNKITLEVVIKDSKNDGEFFIFDIDKKEFRFKGNLEKNYCRDAIKTLDCFWGEVNKSDKAQRMFYR